MSAEIFTFPDAHRQFERDKKVIGLLMAGAEPHRVAEELGMTKAEVYESHTRMMGQVPPDYRARALDLSLRTIDALKRVWWTKAFNPEASLEQLDLATKHIQRLEDQRADRVGLKQLPTREDALDDLKQGETSTENLLRVWREMQGTMPPVIDGEAKPVEETPE